MRRPSSSWIWFFLTFVMVAQGTAQDMKHVDWLFHNEDTPSSSVKADGLLNTMIAEEAKKWVSVISNNARSYVDHKMEFCRVYDNLCVAGNTLRIKNSESSANAVLAEIHRAIHVELLFALQIFEDCCAERLTQNNVQCQFLQQFPFSGAK